MKTWLSSLHPATRIVLAILFIAVIAGGLFFTVFLSRIPSFAGLIDGFQTPIQIYITAPESGAAFPANAAIRVQAEIWSEEPILSYELWVNGVQQANPPPVQTEGSPLQVEWLWTPGSEDVYTLLVKATDAEGGSSLSPAVRITASEPVGAQLFLPLEPGEDPQAAAEAAGLDPQGIALQEAQPGAPAGAFIVYDIPPAESSSPDPASVPAFDAVNTGPAQPFTRLGEIGFWLQTRSDGAAPLPEAPLLAARVEGCNAILSIQSGPGVDGIVIYRVLSGAAPPIGLRTSTLIQISSGNSSLRITTDHRRISSVRFLQEGRRQAIPSAWIFPIQSARHPKVAGCKLKVRTCSHPWRWIAFISTMPSPAVPGIASPMSRTRSSPGAQPLSTSLLCSMQLIRFPRDRS